MKAIHHKVFEAVAHPVWAWNASALRERSREKMRQRAEAFINEVGVEHVVSITEHAPIVGRFSVVVWWYQELPDTEARVIRASPEKPQAEPIE